MRIALGEGYVSTLREVIPAVPENVDYVIYWWNHASEAIHSRQLKRFGLITTNCITQSTNQLLSKLLNCWQQLSTPMKDAVLSVVKAMGSG